MKGLPDIQVLIKPMAFESKSQFEQQQDTPPSLYPPQAQALISHAGTPLVYKRQQDKFSPFSCIPLQVAEMIFRERGLAKRNSDFATNVRP
ncbi:hypothetical protein CEXT_291601 [Caerostris extrusa]|uniref:Uncharacterized protein n=1 Tax=Caerostris extrusa TaxID=172846 RepID=A0AAV4W553_CAEEX|nr:hypothetical protein CEXT_291601 [Caerostris extrusa]